MVVVALLVFLVMSRPSSATSSSCASCTRSGRTPKPYFGPLRKRPRSVSRCCAVCEVSSADGCKAELGAVLSHPGVRALDPEDLPQGPRVFCRWPRVHGRPDPQAPRPGAPHGPAGPAGELELEALGLASRDRERSASDRKPPPSRVFARGADLARGPQRCPSLAARNALLGGTDHLAPNDATHVHPQDPCATLALGPVQRARSGRQSLHDGGRHAYTQRYGQQADKSKPPRANTEASA